MAFQLNSNETVCEGIKRNVRQQIEKSLGYLRGGDDLDETVHEVRIRFKRIRAALRLIWDDLGDEVYRRENYLFRDAARPLTEMRDARVLIETFDSLSKHDGNPLKPTIARAVRKFLVTNRKAIARRVLTEQKAFAKVIDDIEPVLARLDKWTIHQGGWFTIRGGLERVYRTGWRALATARTEPSPENFHEWRKQAKYLWHALQLLDPAWIGDQKDLRDRVHKLARLLGEDHDLVVLGQTLDTDPLVFGGHAVLESLFSLIQRRRETLERQALDLGQSIYGAEPTEFINQIKPNRSTPDSGQKNEHEQTILAAAIETSSK